MDIWVTQCYGYGSIKASSYEKIREDFGSARSKFFPVGV